MTGHEGDTRFGESDRRTFLKRGAYGAGAVALGVDGRKKGRPRRHGADRSRSSQPNILTIVVDQLRTPVWMPEAAPFTSVMPNLAKLGEAAVNFERHYTASNDCTPSRSVLLTGLHTHQTGCMITGASWLDPRFPTWGKMLREVGYKTAYYGKWHLNPNPRASLEQYGFAGGTYPSPNGGPGQGHKKDPLIADQFIGWLREHGNETPWASTVSFVNPHDLAWWHKFTERIPAEAYPAQRATALPPNFETPETMEERGKPLLQRSLQQMSARSFGPVPFVGPEALPGWTQMMDTYILLQEYVDAQIGRVLEALARHPKVAANTVVIFTSDHGEYCGSHGMRGKGASAYEEALRVPLLVHDPRKRITNHPEIIRTQLTSSADITALMLTIGTGSDEWRSESRFSQIAGRHDIAAICEDPEAPGREWVLHATDEDVTEFAEEAHDAGAARHVVAIRTPEAKLAIYSHWPQGSIEPEAAGEESEFYEYGSEQGDLELTSQVGYDPPAKQQLRELLEAQAIPNELRALLPARLSHARKQGIANYFAVDRFESEKVAESRQPAAPEPAPQPL